MFRSDIYGLPPGVTTATETYEAAFRWGQYGVGVITGGLFSSAIVDSGNTPTWEIRPGLVLGQITATGQWTNYSPTATDGSNVAQAVNMEGIRVQDLMDNPRSTYYGILVGGPVQAAKLLGFDLMARQQMDKFQFDDTPFGLCGNHWFPWRQFQTKTANYTIVAGDNFTNFDNTGATGEVDFTLPAIANGYAFGFRAIANFTLKVISNEGINMVAFNNASANSVAFSTGGQIIGGGFTIFSNPGATKWIVVDTSAGSNTVTVA